jgi:pimeloyl-ACP methyl ester carboxylesterase
VIRPLLNSLFYFPSRQIIETPDRAGLDYRELRLESDDGERLHGWWTGARSASLGHLLLCHGNAGNIGDRVLHAALLTAAGFDVLLFDYRGYGRSSGRTSEQGTYRGDRHLGERTSGAARGPLIAWRRARALGLFPSSCVPVRCSVAREASARSQNAPLHANHRFSSKAAI